MSNFEPVFNTRDAARYAREFVRSHMPVFWHIFKPLMPFIAICYFIDTILLAYFKISFPLGSIGAAYFMFALAISWHRVIIHGAQDYKAVNPFNPQKDELRFMGMAMGVAIAFVLSIMIAAGVGALIAPAFGFLFGAAVALIGVQYLFRISFYFPARATGTLITLKQSSQMTKGVCLKIFSANFLATWRVMLAMIAYMIIFMGMIMGVLMINLMQGPSALDDPELDVPAIVHLVMYLFNMPISLYFEPLITVIGVTILSNYYQYVMRNNQSVYDQSAPR